MMVFLKPNFSEKCTVSEKLLVLSNWHFLMKSKTVYHQKTLTSRAQNSGSLLQSLYFFLNVQSGP